MSRKLYEDSYWDEVEYRGGRLARKAVDAVEAGEYDDTDRAVVDLARNVTDDYVWFKPDHPNHGPAFHGQIVEYAQADPENYVDIDAYVEGRGPAEVVRSLAFLSFEADVIEAARERVAAEA